MTDINLMEIKDAKGDQPHPNIYTGCVISNRGSLKFNKNGNNSQNEKIKFMKD